MCAYKATLCPKHEQHQLHWITHTKKYQNKTKKKTALVNSKITWTQNVAQVLQ